MKVEKLEKVTILVLPTIQFGLFDLIEVKQKISPSNFHGHEYEDLKSLQSDIDNKGWTLVTWRRRWNSHPSDKATKALRRSRMVWKRKEKNMKENNNNCNPQENQIFRQKLWIPIALKEFIPKEFFDVDVVSCHAMQVDDIEKQRGDAHESPCEITHVPIGNEVVNTYW